MTADWALIVTDIAILVLVAETIIAAAWIRWRGAPIAILGAILPGICLLLALREALLQAGAMWVILWLALSLPLHLADLARRQGHARG